MSKTISKGFCTFVREKKGVDLNDLMVEYIEHKFSKKQLEEEYIKFSILLTAISEVMELDKEIIISPLRKHEYVLARQIGFTILLKEGLSQERIAYLFNKKDHTTIGYGRTTLYDLVETDLTINKKFQKISTLYQKLIINQLSNTDNSFQKKASSN